MEQETFIYNLSKKLEYTKKGDFQETASIEFEAPSYNTMKESTKLSQFFIKAVMQAQSLAKNQEQQKVDEDTSMDDKAVRIILMHSNIEFMDIVETFIVLACKIGTLDSEKKVKLKADHFKKMEVKDIEDMTCGYIATFIAPSVL